MHSAPYSFPTINLNGTSAEDLFAQYHAVWQAADALHEALAKAMPHGRDYPKSGDHISDSYQNARDQHDARIRAVQCIKADMVAIGQSLARQTNGRA